MRSLEVKANSLFAGGFSWSFNHKTYGFNFSNFFNFFYFHYTKYVIKKSETRPCHTKKAKPRFRKYFLEIRDRATS